MRNNVIRTGLGRSQVLAEGQVLALLGRSLAGHVLDCFAKAWTGLKVNSLQKAWESDSKLAKEESSEVCRF